MATPGVPPKPALVVSHERSGTHFLMNTLALNFGYRPYTDLDERQGFDPRSSPQALEFLLAGWPAATVIKSHHQVELIPALPLLVRAFAVFYVVRDARDALLSFWRYVAASPPGGGPRRATPGEFLRAAPCGRVLRYQGQAAASMVERWRHHVEGWSAAAAPLAGAVTWVRYDELDERFAATTRRLAAALGVAAAAPRRPSPRENVIHPGRGGSGGHRSALTAADQDFVRSAAGETMRRMGFAGD
jgi:hypothetical protein